MKHMIKNPFVWIAVPLLLAGAGYAGVKYNVVSLDSVRNLLQKQPSVEKQEFIAKVNGEGVKTALFDLRVAQVKNAYEAQGATLSDTDTDLLKQQVREEMINKILVAQYGKQQGFEATDETIQQEYQAIVSQFPDEQAFQSSISAQGATGDDVRSTIAQDLVLRQVIDQQAEQSNVEVSEEEIQTTYDEAVAEGAQVPPFEEARAQIESFLRQQKIAEAINALIEQLRSTATIEILTGQIE